MAERSGFFSYVEGDTNSEYDNAFLAKWVASFISNGVYKTDLAVTAGENMQVIIPAGQAWINGYYYRNDGPLTLTLANADGVLHRKDTVVLRWDVNVRSITARVLQGAPASNPVAPAIVRTAEQYDLKIAEVSVPAGTTSITQSLITDTRLDNSVCGIVHAVVDHIDMTTFYQQIAADLAEFKATNESDFAAWLQTMKDIPPEDAAAYLQNQINDILSDKSDKSALTATTLSASGWTGTDAPYTQTISVAGVTTTSANEILPGAEITADQLEALQTANIQDGGQAEGSLTLLAYGDKPDIDLPVRVIVRGDL